MHTMSHMWLTGLEPLPNSAKGNSAHNSGINSSYNSRLPFYTIYIYIYFSLSLYIFYLSLYIYIYILYIDIYSIYIYIFLYVNIFTYCYILYIYIYTYILYIYIYIHRFHSHHMSPCPSHHHVFDCRWDVTMSRVIHHWSGKQLKTREVPRFFCSARIFFGSYHTLLTGAFYAGNFREWSIITSKNHLILQSYPFPTKHQ